VKSVGRDATLTGRTDIWNLALSLGRNPLIGAGFESFWLGPRLEKIWSVYWFHPNQAHNGYVEIFLNLGWIGLGILGLIIATGFRRIVSALRRGEPAANLRLAFFICGLIYNCTEAAFKMLHPVTIFFFLAVIGFRAKSASAPTREAEYLIADGQHSILQPSLTSEVEPVG
jgi:O-antigen ligase